FVMGGALVYFVMLPFVLWFSLSQQIVNANVQIQAFFKVSDYLDLVSHLMLAFGLCFQLPVVLTLAGTAELIHADTLAKGRRDAPDAYARGWSSRGVEDATGKVAAILKLDGELRAAQTVLQEAQARRNEASKQIGQAKARKDEETAQRLMGEVETLKGLIADK